MVVPPSQATLSVVVPAFNEAPSIVRTLESLVEQQAVDEIIVVDNGSEDGTAGIVLEFIASHPKVELITQPQRGVSSARNAGFDSARGTFIARTDADTCVAADWGETIREFLLEHPDTAAVTGLCTYHDSPVGFFLRWGQALLVRFGKLGGQVGNLYGPNMAIRREAWLTVRDDAQVREDVVDDLDLALCLSKRQLRIDQLTSMRAQTSSRRRRTNPRRWWRYQLTGLRTVRDQGFEVRSIHRVAIVGSWIAHTVQWPIYRFWDFECRRFRLRPGAERISSAGRLTIDQAGRTVSIE
ncbi:glycosyltransferase family 2 protein, partial [Nocardia uniformis]